MENPEFYIGGYIATAGDTHFSPKSRYYDQKPPENNNQFAIDDLLDFPNEDEVMTEAFFDNLTGNSSNSSTVTAVDSCNSSISGSENIFSGNGSFQSFSDAQFSSELCVPYDDLAELEWLSNFVEDSFSGDDLQNYQLINDPKACFDSKSSGTVTESRPAGTHLPIFPSDVSVPGKARSKRSRAAPCDWSSRLLVLSPAVSVSSTETNTATKTVPKKRDTAETPGRKCLHCGSEKTPQWRSGPLGPKTLCNACGVRFKSGRLVPEYRPAASPTFVSAKHSNSHRKVMELRRQKDVQRHHHHQQFIGQGSIFGVSNGCDDYLIHHQSGHDYRRMI